MKAITLLNLWVVACGVALCARGETPSAPASRKGARIEFNSTAFDFGKIKAGGLVKHGFVFTNTGDAALEITEVKPGCGCTTAGAWDKKVEPGKTGTIPLQFNSAAFNGAVTKVATVTCNDVTDSNVVLQLSGTVWRPIEVNPEMAVFSWPAGNKTNETKSVRIISHLSDSVTLSDVASTNDSFRAELKTISPGKEFELLITAVAPITNAATSAAISVKTSSNEAPELWAKAFVILQQMPTNPAPTPAVLPLNPTARTVPTRVAVPLSAAK